jgi:hypothetical protein
MGTKKQLKELALTIIGGIVGIALLYIIIVGIKNVF